MKENLIGNNYVRIWTQRSGRTRNVIRRKYVEMPLPGPGLFSQDNSSQYNSVLIEPAERTATSVCQSLLIGSNCLSIKGRVHSLQRKHNRFL
jgi:hypothetical protein